MDIRDRLAALAAAPKPWVCVTRYADGSERRLPCLSEAAARNAAERDARRIGKDLISRETSAIVRIVSVDVERNAA